jgi:GT2 family glycosyltransferase
MMDKIDVVILTWNDGELLDAAVRSALESTGVEVNVIVVDNGSDPPATVVDDPRVAMVRNALNRGVAPGRNQGAAHGTAPFVCFLDSDARLLPSTIGRLLEPLLDSSAVALAAPVFVDQPAEASAGRAPSLTDKALRLLDVRDTYRTVSTTGPWWDVDFAIGACQLMRRSEFEGINGFDETYFYGPEDVDLCLRFREAGRRVVQVAAAQVHHPARRRNRRVLTRRGVQHAAAVARHLWRHRAFNRRVAA